MRARRTLACSLSLVGAVLVGCGSSGGTTGTGGAKPGPTGNGGSGGGTTDATVTTSASSTSTGGCGVTEKRCGTMCVPVDNPAFGCGVTSCTPCAAPDACHTISTCDTQLRKCTFLPKPDGTGCDDGDACTQTDTCQAGVCVGKSPVVCAVDQCNGSTCNPATGKCALPDGTGCDDGNACTLKDSCQAGVCVGGNPLVCSGTASCVGGACSCPGVKGFPMPLVAMPNGAATFVVADFNGDGKPDIATLALDYVYIRLNQGNGTFSAPEAHDLYVPNSTLDQFNSIATADVNGDGHLDLVLSNDENGIDILVNNGNGTFGAPSTIPMASVGSTYGYSIAIADLNGDGKPDIATIDSHGVAVFLSTPGGFASPLYYTESFASSVAAADVDGDGKIDLVVLADNQVDVLLNAGTGVFGAPIHNPSPGDMVRVADLNGDGKPDVAVSDSTSSSVHVLLNQGTGSFAPKVDYPLASAPQDLTIADLDGDGKLDIAAVDGDHTVTVLLNQGGGTFANSGAIFAGDGSGSAVWVTQIVAQDMNADGKPDLVVGTANGVSTLENLGAAKLATTSRYTFAPLDPVAAAVADLNGDGFADTILLASDSSTGAQTLEVRLSLGDGTLGPAASYPAGTGATLFDNASAVVGDVNGDGKPDILVTDAMGVNVLVNQGSGTFAPLVHYAANGVQSLALGDLNGDGKPDIALAGSILLNQGNGTFGVAQSYGTVSPRDAVAVADLNGDGKPDLVLTGADPGAHIFLNQGGGTFGTPTVVMMNTALGGAALGDVNGDGKPDLVVWGNGLWVLLNQGNGTFGTAASYLTDLAANDRVTGVAMSDLNGDGKLDLAVTRWEGGVGVLYNQGTGTFAAPLEYTAGSHPMAVGVGDINGDKSPDLVVLSQDSFGANDLTVLLNTCLP